METLYNIIIYSYYLLIRLAAVFNEKARLWVAGRKDVFDRIKKDVNETDNIAWFHAASLGEFEQGRMVLEAFRKKFPEYKILLTFFSPSGYEIRKNYDGADFIYYLPIDIKSNARKFIEIVNPQIAFFIKYEFWFNYLNLLKTRNIPTYLISGIFRKEQHFFKWYGKWSRKVLRKISFFFVQNQKSFDLLNSIGINQAVVCGDTRFDRVFYISKKALKFPLVENFIENKKVLLAGSTWPKDEELIGNLLNKFPDTLKIIIAPHEVYQNRIQSILERFNNYNALKFSLANESNIKDSNVLIIDRIGLLSSLYQYCDIAFIGGGFGKGIHNVLEAVTFGKPVIFGPNYHKFAEAVELKKIGGAFAVENFKEFVNTTNNLLTDQELYSDSSFACKKFISENRGATQLILDKISDGLNIV